MALRAGVLAASVALVLGCTVGPDYVRPAAPTAVAFREAEGWKPAQPRDEAPRGSWWEAFGDAELNALVQQVDLSNQTLRAAEARVRGARATTQATRAGLFPTVAGNANASRSGRGGGSGTGSVGSNYSIALDAGWEIDLWGRVQRGIEANESTTQASVADLAAARLSAQALLVQDYLLLRVQDAEIQLLRDTVTGYVARTRIVVAPA